MKSAEYSVNRLLKINPTNVREREQSLEYHIHCSYIIHEKIVYYMQPTAVSLRGVLQSTHTIVYNEGDGGIAWMVLVSGST